MWRGISGFSIFFQALIPSLRGEPFAQFPVFFQRAGDGNGTRCFDFPEDFLGLGIVAGSGFEYRDIEETPQVPAHDGGGEKTFAGLYIQA